MMDVRALHTDDDYRWALREVETYFHKEPDAGSIEADRFDVLSAIIRDYEDRHHAIAGADPVDVLRFAIDSMGHTQTELGELIGRSRASEVLNRKRRLTLDMIRAISAQWKLPIEALAGAYELERERA